MQANCSQPAENLNGKRIQAGGYICNQMIDEALMHNADVLRSIDAITGASVPQAEICGDVSDDQQDRFFRNENDYG